MRKNIILLIVFITFIFSSNPAKAELLVEPFAGVAFNSSAELGGNEFSFTGSSVGGRLGFLKHGFSLGLDGRRNAWSFEPDSGGADTDYTFNQLGFFVGYELPSLVRFWVNYVFSMEGVNDDDDDLKLKEGSGLVFGVGFKIIPFMSLNFELSNLTTTKAETATSEGDFDADYTGYTISLSIPVSI